MNRTKTIWMAVALAVVAGLAAWAGVATAVRATVPFDFMVADQKVPAGEYLILRSASTSAVHIQSRENGTTIMIGSAPGNKNKTGYAAALSFNKYGNQYFLTEFWVGGETEGVQVAKSKTEKKLAERPENYNIAASTVRYR